MKRILLTLLLTLFASPAGAALIDVQLSSDGTLKVANNAQSLGSLFVFVDGASDFAFEPTNTGISLADSVYSLDPLSIGLDALIVNNTAFGVTIAAGGTTTTIGRFTLDS